MNHTNAILILIITYLFIPPGINQAQDNGWTWLYPKPQGNTLNDIFIFSKEKAVAVGNAGVIIKTTNGGNDWDVISNAGGTSYDLHSVQFIDEENGWAAGMISQEIPTDGNILIKTSDGGKSWTSVKVNTTLPLYSVHFVDADTGIVVGEDGIVLRTTDGGRSWDTRKMDDYITPHRFLDIFNLNKVVFTDKMNGWIIGFGYYGNQIYRTTDCGRSWKWNVNIISPKVNTSLNDISFAGNNNIYIAGGNGTFLKSTDGGTSWKYTNLSSKYRNITYQYLYSVCFTDSLNGIITGGDYNSLILKTTDGGDNWKEIDSAKYLKPLYKIRFSDKSSAWTIGVQGMIFRTTDEGSTWSSQLKGVPDWFESVYFTDTSNGWAVGEKGNLIHTTDGGKSWIKQSSMSSGWLYDVKFSNKNNGWVVGYIDSVHAGALRTTDGGITWIPQMQGIGGLKSIYFVNPDTGWMVGNLGRILKTTNGGDSWINQDGKTNRDLFSCSFINSKTGWAAGNAGTFRKTTDGGESWINAAFDSTVNIKSIYFVNEKTGWAGGEGYVKGNLFKTEDGGLTWNIISAPPGAIISSVFFIDENNGWIAGWGLGPGTVLKRTSDGGKTWLNELSPSTGALSKMFFLDENFGFLAGHGLSKTTNGGMLVSVETSERYKLKNFSEQFALLQNYPNPFNPSTVINYQLPSAGRVTLKVYDILGKVVTTLVDEYKNEGSYSVKFNARNLPSGIYFYTLTSGEFSETKKFILIK